MSESDGGADIPQPNDQPSGPPRGFAGAGPSAPGGFPQVNVPAVPTAPTVPTAPASRPTPKKGNGGLIVALVAVIALAAGGIWFVTSSGDDESGTKTTVGSGAVDPDGPGAAYTAWFQAIVAGDYEAACQLIASSTQDEFAAKGIPCETVMADAKAKTGFLEDTGIRIVSESIDGDQATVTFELGAELQDGPAHLVRDGDAWKVDLFADDPDSVPEPADDAESAACESEKSTLEVAVNAYFAQNGEYPPDTEALVGGFLKKLPTRAKVEPGGKVVPIGECA